MNWHTEPARHTVSGWVGELHAPEIDRRLIAAEALSRLGYLAADAVIPLARMLQDPNVAVRKLAALALGRIGKPAVKALPDLVAALEDSHSGVRHRVVVALSEILYADPEARVWFYQVQGTVAGEAAYLLADILSLRSAA